MNTKLIFAGALLALLASSAQSCSVKDVCSNVVSSLSGTREPSGEIVEKSYAFGSFDAIDVGTGIIVSYTQQPQMAPVVIKGPSDVVDVTEVEVKDGTLTLILEKDSNFRFANDERRLYAYVYAPAVNEFDAHSGARIIVPDTLRLSSKVEADASSGSSISFSSLLAPVVEFGASSGAAVTADVLEADKFEADASSGAQISASGKAVEVDFEASSGASVSCGKLKAGSGNAKASSGGSVDCAIRNASISRSSGGTVSNDN